jgi:hypothetical protein
MTIGCDGSGASDPFDGWMDDICVWNRALSAAEVWQAYVESAAGYPGAFIRPRVLAGATSQPALPLRRRLQHAGQGIPPYPVLVW